MVASKMAPTRAELRDLLRIHGPYAGRTLRYLGVRERDLDDALQEVFMVVHRRLTEYEPRTRFESWLRVICVNVARNRRRTERRKPTVSIEELSEHPLAAAQEEDLERKRLRDTLLELLDALPEEQRLVIVMNDIEELSVKEIAEIAGCPPKTVYSRLYTARASLRDAIRTSRMSTETGDE
jgi:RNA polymerase sigma-70 factor (ECF subfamily)